jgi:hypothetical protein
MSANFTSEQVAEAIAEFIRELTANAATEATEVGVGYNGNITIFKNEQNENTAS